MFDNKNDFYCLYLLLENLLNKSHLSFFFQTKNKTKNLSIERRFIVGESVTVVNGLSWTEKSATVTREHQNYFCSKLVPFGKVSLDI